jgi:NAD-dependent dihydropyrimidine dehydrogenase PreA subunit
MAFKVKVDEKKCTGCEECAEACTVGVFEIREHRSVPVGGQKCLGCESCLTVCERKAITVEELKVKLSDTARSLFKDIPSD